MPILIALRAPGLDLARLRYVLRRAAKPIKPRPASSIAYVVHQDHAGRVRHHDRTSYYYFRTKFSH
jgi:hypothetical protein